MSELSVLMLGSCRSVFTGPLVSALHRAGDFRFGVLDPSPRLPKETFGTVMQVSSPRFRRPWPPRPAGGLRVSAVEAPPALKSAGDDGLRSGLRDLGLKVEVSLLRRRWRDVFAGYDVYHVLGMFVRPCHWALRLLPADAPVIVAIMGSDLMWHAGVRFYREQSKILARADVIAVHGVLMREILLSKFGRHLEPKIRMNFVGIGEETLSAIDALDAPAVRRGFLEEHGLDPSRRMICIGHSGHRRNGHLEVVDALAELPAAACRRVSLMVPMTYGAAPDYLAELRRRLESSGLPFVILEEFLSEEDVVRLRVSSDIMIHVPRSDAFSAAMVQTLYAGNMVITGAWLPYDRLRRSGIRHFEITAFGDLAAVAQDALAACESKGPTAATREYIRAHWGTDAVARDWAKLYDAMAQGAYA